jgi:hypothetical protein
VDVFVRAADKLVTALGRALIDAAKVVAIAQVVLDVDGLC